MTRLIATAIDEEAALLASKLTDLVAAIETLITVLNAVGASLDAIEAKVAPFSYTGQGQLRVTGGLL